MTQIQYVGPDPAREVPEFSLIVERGDIIDVPEDRVEAYVVQLEVWVLADAPAKAAKAAPVSEVGAPAPVEDVVH